MGQITIGTAFFILCTAVCKIPAALITQQIQRTETKQAVKTHIIRHVMAWKVFTFVVHKITMAVIQ
jgi:succinate-acetate transporter protein